MELNREAWLQKAIEVIRPWFVDAGLELPATIHISVGFPSKGALSRKLQRIGECWRASTSADGNPQIFINPTIADGVRALDIVVHELIHAALPDAKHGAKFGAAARKLGLEGPNKATIASDALRAKLEDVIQRIGLYPHAGLNPVLQEKKQTTRLLKVVCLKPSCEMTDDNGKTSRYTLRMTRGWLDREGFGAPICPNCESIMTVEDKEEVQQ